MKKHLITVLTALILLAGIGLLSYPSLSNYLNEKNSSRAIATYQEAVAGLSETDYSADRQAAITYNEELAACSGIGAAVAMETHRTDSPYETLLNITGNGVMGAVKIPVIGVNLPIYHGTDEATLQIAVGHYQGSSLPVGGPGTHAILSGHRGLPSAKLFTDLDQLVEGDVFYIQVLDEILEYQIDQIQVVLPEEVDGLSIVDGEDYVTLVTCTPYGINSHRILIRGTRIAYDGRDKEKVPVRAVSPEVKKERDQGTPVDMKTWLLYTALAFVAILLVGSLIPVKGTDKAGKHSRKKTERDENEDENDE